MKKIVIIIIFLVSTGGYGQYYFPPVNGSHQWDTISPATLGWCTQNLDTLSDYLNAHDTRSFLILYKGRIAYERYYHGFKQDSSWYWASAGKSLVSFLIGMAQHQGLLNINDKTSDYLGSGWSVEPAAKENLITIKHQLSMTTGLDFTVPDPDCVKDTCLKYKYDAGSHWYYHNAPYYLLQDVLKQASGKSMNVYTYQALSPVGFTGLWFGTLYFSTARSMARFGLLNLNKGIWNGATIMNDSSYRKAMVNPSQNLNPAYGYLWWLNGGISFRQPGFDISFPGSIIPTAPPDLYMAAGANDQRIYIVPSLDLVVVRQGNEAYSSQAALSQFDPELWGLIMNVICSANTRMEETDGPAFRLYPNPAYDFIEISDFAEIASVNIYSMDGRKVKRAIPVENRISLKGMFPGMYILQFSHDGKSYSGVFLIR